MHTLYKLWRTIHMLFTLGCARMLGQYIHSEWNGEFNLAKYRWCGKEWAFPTSSYEDHDEQD